MCRSARLSSISPEGPYSALAANANLCTTTRTQTRKRKITRRLHGHTVHQTITTRSRVPAGLVMPTEMTAQNGAVIKQNTPIQVTGCTTNTTKTKQKHKKPKASKASDANAGRGRTHS